MQAAPGLPLNNESSVLLAEKAPSAVGGRIDAIEGLRTILTFAVFAEHYNSHLILFGQHGGGSYCESESTPAECWYTSISQSMGSWAVGLFFVISGFVDELPARHGTEAPEFTERLRRVAVKYLRFAPVYYFALLACLVIGLASSQGDFLASLGSPRPPSPTLALVLDLFMLQSWWPDRLTAMSTNGPAWFVSSLFGCFIVRRRRRIPMPLTKG